MHDSLLVFISLLPISRCSNNLALVELNGAAQYPYQTLYLSAVTRKQQVAQEVYVTFESLQRRNAKIF